MEEIKKLPQSKMELMLEIPWEDWKVHIDQAVKDISGELKIDGFRPGKAPRSIVEQKVGTEMILNNAAQRAIEKSYVDYVTKKKLAVLDKPEVEIMKLAEGNTLEYKAIVSVMPEVIISDSYVDAVKKVNKEFREKKAGIKDDDVLLEIEKVANSRAKLVTVRREARKDDNVVLDFDVIKDGKPIENGSSKDHQLVLGKGVFIPGFEENIEGMKEGESKEFSLDFPADYHQKELAGQSATFRVKLNLVQERQLPTIDDEFAKSLGKFDDLAALKKSIQDGMENEAEHKLKDDKRNQYLDKVAEYTKADIPEVLISEETDIMIHEFEHQIQNMGMGFSEYLEKIGQGKEDLAKNWRPQAEKRVLASLILKELVKKEEISVDSSEVEAEMNKTLQYYKKVKDLDKNIDMERLYNYTKNVLENEKLFDLLEKK